MGKDEWLIAFALITLLSARGFLAVSFFRNRESNGYLDYLIEPQWMHDNDAKGPLRDAMQRAARNLGFTEDCANEETAFFIPDQSRQLLFEEAEKQNIVLWDGPNLRVLAFSLERALERKLRRIHNKMQSTKWESDTNDALALLRTMDEVAAAYRRKYDEEVL
ncbi:uncharacterized protein PGRI_055250 [Penicillium griseofulvum]|uniref:Uncharacterized protein n=1 Tax=Penicillium patulum TaxID=5078 RepID=A0A135LCH8_PENPA|nr:uncharacterized protein PGRI_055250 [Penicillium griseofulvum]KXG46669.1 hypothetical protein PGRI_055250 [Penicillium griseofulvum]